MSIKIGSISISLTAETSSFQSGMDKASQVALNSSKNIERSFKTMGVAITGALSSAVGALGILVDKTQETVFSLQKMAQQAGTSIESFSKLAYAAKVAGMPTDQLAQIMTRLSHSQLLAAGGSLEQAAAFKTLGVNVTDANGRFKDSGDLLVEVAKKLDTYRASTNKTGIETIIMGRSGAQAAELMSVLANRFGEVSATAEKLGVVFTEQTAQGAQKLHDSLTMIEEAGTGLSVRLLSQLSPALDDVAQKIVAMLSNAETMKNIEGFGAELADGIHLAGEALEYVVEHLSTMKAILGSLAAIRLAGLFGPMIASASEANGVMGKLGIASLNLTGDLLGVRRMGSVFVPLAKDAAGYATTLGALAAEEGVAGAASIAMADALAAARAAMSSVAVPLAIITAGIWATTKALESEKAVAEGSANMAVTWSDMWHGAIDNVKEDFHDLGDVIKAVMTGNWSYLADVKFTRLGDAAANEAKKRQAAAEESPNVKPKQTRTGPQKDIGGIQLTRNDEMQKKLDDLVDKAHAAQAALALVGHNPQEQRNAAITAKYNEFLTQQKDQLEKLTPAQREHAELLAHAAIVTQVNAEAATKYATDLNDLHESLAMSTEDHLAMAAAIGKSADAMQNAMVSAQVNQKMRGIYGEGWQNNAQAVADAKKLGGSYRDDLNRNNQYEDKRTADNLNLQLAAQQRLNAAILQGAEAKRQAAIISEQAAVKADFINRGDTDSNALQHQLDAVRKKSDIEAQAADLERANGMSASARYQEQTLSILDAVAAAKKYGVALDYREVLAADKQAWNEYQDAQNKAILETGSGLDGLRVALQQMATDAQTTAQIMHDAFAHAVDSINQSLSSSLMAHANNSWEYKRNIVQGLSNTSRGIGSSLLNQGFKKIEGTALNKLGFGKADGSSANPFYVRLAGDAAKGIGGLAGSIGSLKGLGGFFGHNKVPSVNVGGWADSLGMKNGATGVLGRLIQGKFADGGNVMPGMPALIGERGPELFVPPSAGRIVPNDALGGGAGGTHHWHIDATGSHDPAQTVALIHQYMTKAAPQIAAGAVRAVHEQARRSPVSSAPHR